MGGYTDPTMQRIASWPKYARLLAMAHRHGIMLTEEEPLAVVCMAWHGFAYSPYTQQVYDPKQIYESSSSVQPIVITS